MNRLTRRMHGIRIPVWGDKPVPDHQVKDSGRRKNPCRMKKLGQAAREAERSTEKWLIANGQGEVVRARRSAWKR